MKKRTNTELDLIIGRASSSTEWREITEAPGYFVSESGLVKGLLGRILNLPLNPKGYVVCRLPVRKYCKGVHRTVADAFIPNPDNKSQVNHIDGNKLNNHVSNLEWCTVKENIQHAIRTGLRTRKSNLRSNSIFTPLTVKIIKQAIAEGFTGRQVAKYFRCDDTTISKIKVGVHYPHISA